MKRYIVIGGFTLIDSRGLRISLKQLMYQYKSGDEEHEDFLK